MVGTFVALSKLPVRHLASGVGQILEFDTDGGVETLTNLRGRKTMLWTIFVILLVLWLLGLIGGVGGGLIHLLLVIAAVVLVLNLLSGRRTVV
jgi:4-hydroxybenzoate polyprenyltransferase